MIHFLTPDRGDRPELLKHCKEQVLRMHPSGLLGHHWIISHTPPTDRPDLTDRIKKGCHWIDSNVDIGDWAFIIENDDFYPADYLNAFSPHLKDYDFIGSDRTIYYNIRNRTWEETHHPNHSSLFCTAFRVSAMSGFKWHQAHPVFLDLDIWKYAKRFRRKFIDTGAIGIKGHGQGLCGGKGHVQTFPNKDADMSWLQSRVDKESFEFYSKLKV